MTLFQSQIATKISKALTSSSNLLNREVFVLFFKCELQEGKQSIGFFLPRVFCCFLLSLELTVTFSASQTNERPQPSVSEPQPASVPQTQSVCLEHYGAIQRKYRSGLHFSDSPSVGHS